MRAYIGASFKVSKNLRIGAAIPVQLEAFKHFAAVLVWMYIIGSILRAFGVR